MNDGQLNNQEVIFEVVNAKSGGQHFGSRFAWMPDETLLFSVGNGGNSPAEYEGALIREQAQSLEEHFGKIIRIHDDGAVLRLKTDPQGGFLAQERIDLGAFRVRDIGQSPDGFLYVLTDTIAAPSEKGSQAGTLLRIDQF